jgi:hypothetical protein
VTINFRKSNKNSPVPQQMLSPLPSSRNALSILAEHAAAAVLQKLLFLTHVTLAVGNKRLPP